MKWVFCILSRIKKLYNVSSQKQSVSNSEESHSIRFFEAVHVKNVLSPAYHGDKPRNIIIRPHHKHTRSSTSKRLHATPKFYLLLISSLLDIATNSALLHHIVRIPLHFHGFQHLVSTVAERSTIHVEQNRLLSFRFTLFCLNTKLEKSVRYRKILPLTFAVDIKPLISILSSQITPAFPIVVLFHSPAEHSQSISAQIMSSHPV